MQTIVLVMQRRSVAQGITQKLQEIQSLCVLLEPYHSRARAVICARAADIALIEVAETGHGLAGCQGISECLALCGSLREEAPQCRLLLMCPEGDREAVAQAVEAKRQGRVNDFVFYDTTISYLVSKLLSM